MAPVVVFVLALLAPAFGFPFLTPEYTPEIQIQQETPVTNTVPQTGYVQEKTGAPTPTGCSAGYSQQVPFNQENVQPVTRVQEVPVNVEHAPVAHTETPLFLPPQPVVPVSQPQQVVRPVIVPAEAIASGRVIIMAVEPIQQRAFPDVIIVPQQQQQIVTETYTPIQQIQAVEKQSPYQENYTPVQQNVEQYNPQQTTQQNYNEVQQKQGQYQQAPVEQTAEKQAYQVQNLQQQVYSTQHVVPVQVQTVQEQVAQQVENIQKQGQTGAEYTPISQTVGTVQQVQGVKPTLRVQTPEPVHHEENVQQSVEQYHQQVEPQQQVYSAQPVAEYVQQQQQQSQSVTGQVEPQQRVYVQEAAQPQVQQQTYSVQPEQVQQQTYSVQPEQVQQQTYSVQPEHVQQHQSVEPQQVQQVPENVHVPVTKTGNQQVGTYESAQSYNFGDRIQQQNQAQNVVPQQQHFVQPVVVENQQ